MTPAEAADQRREFEETISAVLGTGPDLIARLAVQSMSEEYTELLREYGYEISIGTIENGNVVVGLVNRNATVNAPGYVLAEFSADHVRDMLK